MAKQLELFDTFPVRVKIDDDARSIIMSDSDGIKKDYSLICQVDATHSGTLINSRVYPPKSMKTGIKTWTNPYKKPVLVNHNDSLDPVGRVIKAKYIETSRALDGSDYKPVLKESDGYGYQKLTIKVTDSNAIQKILDGRYETVSVRMTTNHAFCSICDSDWSETGPCDHTPGQNYDKKLAYITTGDLSYKEVSFVNIPADQFAGVKEALLSEDSEIRSPVDVLLYANSPEDKVLSNLNFKDGINLYSLIDDSVSGDDDVVLHLLNKSSKEEKPHKEEDVKLEELTKDTLKDLDVVKGMIKEAVEEISKKLKDEYEVKLNDAQKGKKKEDCDIAMEELKQCKVDLEKTSQCDDVKSELEEKSNSIKDLEKEIVEKDEEKKKLLEENVEMNAELHKIVAERLYDLKKILSKPDVTDVKTPDGRKLKVEEFSKRSIESLKDQISDLILEQEKFMATGLFVESIDSPGAAPVDKTNEVKTDTTPKNETKKDKLKRLFSKS